ncbi:MAG: CopG family transcriptional regulator [Acidimicrobiia bacterium]
MQRTNIYLDEGQLRVLDRMAAEEGTSRAELIRRLLDGCLAGGDRDLNADVEAIEASFGALGGFDLPERGSDDRGRHLDRMWSLRG